MKVNLRKKGCKVILRKRFVNLIRNGKHYTWR